MTKNVKVAAMQMSCNIDDIWDINKNINTASELIYQAKQEGVQIALLPELFETPYFCQHEDPENFKYATNLSDNLAIKHFVKLAKELDMVIPVSFYEKHNQAYYNSIAVIDATGEILGVYRKSHIPDGPGYEEKYYFNLGDTGFMVFDTKYAKIGIGICWDQWYPETARILSLLGAEILLFPTAIGSEPHDANINSKDHWQICMQGHSASNLIPVVCSNRIGTEQIKNTQITFYGSAFITNNKGKIIQEADSKTQTILTAEFDLDSLAIERRTWGIFRDRRPDLYGVLLTHDGKTK